MEYKAISEKERETSSSDCSLGDPGSPPSTDSSFNFEDSSASSSTCSSELYRVGKRSRLNTLSEKRKMRNSRKKKKHLQHLLCVVKDLQSDLKHTQASAKRNEEKAKYFRQISRTFWERWRWELQKKGENQ